jgi:Holliday junction resolvase RusA-like endonuclease
MPDTCIHGRRVAQSCPGCGNAPAAERERADAEAEPLVYRVTIPGNPGPAAVNARSTPCDVGGRFSVQLSKLYRQWRALAIACMQRAAAPYGASLLELRHGPLAVEVRAYWPRQHQKGPAEGQALGDVDAVIKACLDAMRKPEPAKPPKPGKKRGTPARPGAWIFTDDSQADDARLRKFVDADNPRIEIEVRRAP